MLANRVVAPEHNLLTVATVEIGRRARAGQFAQIRVPGDAVFLPRPFSFLAAAEDHCQFLSRAVGPGTRALAQVAPGTELELLGPLGQGFDLTAATAAGAVVLVGGGVGVPPLVHAAAELAPLTGSALIGAARGELVLGVKELAGLGWQVQIATDDGSRGHHGLVTDLLEEALATAPVAGGTAEEESPASRRASSADLRVAGARAGGSAANLAAATDAARGDGVAATGDPAPNPRAAPISASAGAAASGSAANRESPGAGVPVTGAAGAPAAAPALGRGRAVVLACGPYPMLRRCAELAAAAGVACQVAMEEPMACGFGVCLGCAIRMRAAAANGAAGAAYALVCRDGPVFAAERVWW